MRLKMFFAAVCCLAASGAAYSSDMAELYERASASLRGGKGRNEIFLGSELASANFMDKLNNLYYSSVYENPSDYSDLFSLTPEELDKKIIKELKSVDFEEIIKTVKADTDVKPLPKRLGGGKLTGIQVRRWLESSRKAEAEIKAKKTILGEIKNNFNVYEKRVPFLKEDLKVKLYISLKRIINHINDGGYSSAKKVADYINRYIIR